MINNGLVGGSSPLPRVLGKLFDERPFDQNIGEHEDLFDACIAVRD